MIIPEHYTVGNTPLSLYFYYFSFIMPIIAYFRFMVMCIRYLWLKYSQKGIIIRAGSGTYIF
jgi:hypothetical protein